MNKPLLIIGCFLLSSCINRFPLEDRQKLADQIAATSNLSKSIVKTSFSKNNSQDGFLITTYSKIKNPTRPILNIYIEGDGYAFKNRHTISNNPTPINPVALRMAAVDEAENILYIARPCQYADLNIDKNCQNKFWTNSRFSKDVIYSTNDVINQIVKKYKIKSVNLHGFSGGGAVAVLVAANRKDVASIKTIAANLNHRELLKFHNVTALTDSLDAIDVAKEVKSIPQLHLAGGKDHTVPFKFIESFVKEVNVAGGEARFKIISDAGHEYEKWPEVWLKILKDGQ